MVEDRVQNLNFVTWGIFQIYDYDSLFNSDQNIKIQNKKRLKKKTAEVLINKLSVPEDQQENEAKINEYTNEHEIRVTWPTCY